MALNFNILYHTYIFNFLPDDFCKISHSFVFDYFKSFFSIDNNCTRLNDFLSFQTEKISSKTKFSSFLSALEFS